jgi:rRNA pseudouridine-1189 N-methylase Emg1 (Nep1/Mra1 family)
LYVIISFIVIKYSYNLQIFIKLDKRGTVAMKKILIKTMTILALLVFLVGGMATGKRRQQVARRTKISLLLTSIIIN